LLKRIIPIVMLTLLLICVSTRACNNSELVDLTIHNGSVDKGVNVWDEVNFSEGKDNTDCCSCSDDKGSPRARCLIGKYEPNYEEFREIETNDKIVYFHQRKIGEAYVEKDFMVYQFNRNTGELLAKKRHWRNDLPEHLSQSMIAKEQAESLVEGEVQFSKLYIISPESDVFTIKPTPMNPCWIVRSIDTGNLIVTIVDAVNDKILGNGIPPPYTAFSMSGPQYFDPCGGVWYEWYKNAEFWFNEMGYSTESVQWPTEEKIKSHIQSNETAVFYEIAHSGGRSDQFKSGCLYGNEPEYTYAYEVEEWIANYTKMPFAFLASCFSMCNTSDGNLSYEFRKGSMKNTVTIGYCNMSDEKCFTCWIYSLDWQDRLFNYMNQSYTVKYAFDQANADYPCCASTGCMRFAGDEDFKVVPKVKRVPIVHDVAITDVSSSKTVVGEKLTLNLSVCVENQGDFIETFSATAYANTTIIDTFENFTLTSGDVTTLTFIWNTTGIAKGNYTIKAKATSVPSETDLDDNTLIADECVCVTIQGDVDCDRDVDLYDAVKLLVRYGAKKGQPECDPNCDIDGDGDIDLFDAVILLTHYGQKYP
jgi:hypothetical protein